MTDYKDLKEVLDFGLTVAMIADQKLQDGFQWTDVFGFVPTMVKLPKAVEGIENVPYEIAELEEDENGRAELVAYVKEIYDIDDDHAEKLVEHGIRVGLELGLFIMMLRDGKVSV